MRRGGTLVIVEVRYRGPGSRLAATETITYRKRQRLLRATEHFLARHRRYAGMAVRFDVVGIDRDPAGKTRLQWIRDAFRPGD